MSEQRKLDLILGVVGVLILIALLVAAQTELLQ
jgi:hypothetical protein